MLDCQGPKCWVGDVRPMDGRVQHHGSGDGHDCSDVAFGNSIVMMGADTSKAYNLLKVGQVAGEFSGGECFRIVGEVFLWNDTGAATHHFEFLFGFECFV